MNCNLREIPGVHAAFYYYGNSHLYINLLHYIQQGLENNEIIYLIIDHEYFNISIQIPIEKIDAVKFIDIKQDICELEWDSFVKDALKQGFNGVRWIIQSSYVIRHKSKKQFFDLEEIIGKRLDNNSSLLCAFDYKDYIDKKEYIDDEVYYKSLERHEYFLHRMALVEYDELFRSENLKVFGKINLR